MFIAIMWDKVSIYRAVEDTLPFRINQACFTHVPSKISPGSLKSWAVRTPQVRRGDLLKIAYLINQSINACYSFIHREIQALERRGIDWAVDAIAGLYTRGSLS
jgi:hypothetical protein